MVVESIFRSAPAPGAAMSLWLNQRMFSKVVGSKFVAAAKDGGTLLPTPDSPARKFLPVHHP